ncbi:alcohol dehydrogenase, partial [Paenibacillus dendritiformis]|nr:alcohol dehydrogenase [Paenibacillus dendritiformis]
GRYARDYEVGGFDYPLGYVRWTEGRNVAEYVRLLAAGRIRVDPLISAELPMEKADIAYARYKQSPKDTIGVVLRYADAGRS